jgi:phosphate:Na+ symporter
MEMFEEALKRLWGPKLSFILQKYTDKWWKATLVGTVITGILNSSTLISLLTLWFVSAGMMKLVNAVGVLVGANIWSTATWLIVGYLWFWEFKISAFALPLIAIWWFIMIISGSKYRSYRAKLLIGFGLFFLGIDFLKENVEVMSQVFDFGKYKDMNLWIFGIIGMIITALVQSSWAVGVMTLAALSSGIITFEAWFAIILWANIGTTFTALIASLTGSTAKRQIGIANVLFNIITVAIGIVLFYPYIWVTLDVLGFRSDPVMGNAIINLVFNATTSLLFIPFLGWFTKLIIQIIPDKKEQFPLQILQISITTNEEKYDRENATIYLKALQDDKKYLTRQALTYISLIWWIDTNRIENNEPDASVIDNTIKFDNEYHKNLYSSCKNQLDLVFAYIQQLSSMNLDKDDRKELDILLAWFIWLSNAIKSTENIRENINTLRDALDPNVRTLYYELLVIIIRLNKAIYIKIGRTPLSWKEDIHNVIEDMRTYRNTILSHIAPYVIHGNVGDMDVSSLVNMNGELTDCMKSMAKII